MRTWVTACAMAVGMMMGCERTSSTTPVPGNGAATAPANTTNPATQNANASATQPSTNPTPLTLTVEGAVNEFPSALIRLDQIDDRIIALLYTNDPPAALKDDYQGNSFYFELPLDIAAPGDITAARYDFKSSSSELSETPEGIFLSGRRWQLQPDDIRIDFHPDPSATPSEGAPTAVKVRLVGTFRLFDAEGQRTTSASIVPVAGEFTAKIINRPN